MDHFEEKLSSFEPRKPTEEQRERILANAPAAKVDVDAPKHRSRLLSIATSRWFLLAGLPLLLFGTAGICAVSIEGHNAGKSWRDVQEMLENAGETLDLNDLAPAPVADAENFMATPALHGIEKMGHPRDAEILAKHERINAIPRITRPKKPGARLDFGTYTVNPPEGTLISELGGNPEEKFLELVHSDTALWEELAIASRRSHSQPVHSISERNDGRPIVELSMGHLGPLQKISQLSSLRAVAAARLGDRKTAYDSLSITIKCRDAAATEPSMIGGLVAFSINSMLEDKLPEIIKTNCLTTDHLRQLQNKIASQDPIALGLKMFRSEMAFAASGYSELLKRPRHERANYLNGPIPSSGFSFESVVTTLTPNSFYVRNRTTSIEWIYRHNVAPLKEFDIAALRAASGAAQRQIDNTSWFSYGSLLANFSIESTGGLNTQIIGNASNVQLMTTGLALERFHIDNGNFPPNLEALVPQYLESVPIDFAAGDSATPEPISYELAPGGKSYTLSATPLHPEEENPRNDLRFER